MEKSCDPAKFIWTKDRQVKLMELYHKWMSTKEIANFFGITEQQAESALEVFCAETD